jgi:N-methylhydantoinase A
VTDRTWQVGADIGGTFTDIVALSDDGELRRAKVLTRHRGYAEAIVEGLAGLLEVEELAVTDRVTHGTTIATNAILEQSEANIGLITTKGFRDVLELRRARRPSLYDLAWRPPTPLVPRERRLELDERLAADGTVVREVTSEALEACIDQLEKAGVIAVAVCLLNSYANPAHEEQVAERVRRRLPQVDVTVSSALAPEIKEYERTSTTVVNAFLLPVIQRYVRELANALHEIRIVAPLEIMQSDGTTASADSTADRPFRIIESGPAAGVVAAAALAKELDRRRVIAFDMGGTTAKASLVDDFRAGLTDELEVGDSLTRGAGLTRGSGYTVRSPCIDLTEVGAGGGSIAWVDDGGTLRVGPASAGSDPGPACYGLGGTEATVADAHVVLGYLNPSAIAGGSKDIAPDLARDAIGVIAGRLGLSLLDAAYGIYEIASAQMQRAVRGVSVERGRDPREYSLVAFGGAGGLHAAAMAAELEMREVVVPIAPGLFSSLGLLFSDVAATRLTNHRAPLAPETMAALRETVDRLAARARTALREELAAVGDIVSEVSVALRYVGQSSSLMLGLGDLDDADEAAVAALTKSFHREHARVYGHAAEGEAVETVSIMVTALAPRAKFTFTEIGSAYDSGAGASAVAREMYFGPLHGTRSAAIISRADLRERPVSGPAVIEEFDTTIIVPPDVVASAHETGSVLLRVSDGVDPTTPRAGRRRRA